MFAILGALLCTTKAEICLICCEVIVFHSNTESTLCICTPYSLTAVGRALDWGSKGC